MDLHRDEVIRIDIFREGPWLVVRVAGAVAGSDVTVLQEAIDRAGLPNRIELAEVDFVDPAGASALLALEAGGATLVGLEPYVELLVRTPPRSVPL